MSGSNPWVRIFIHLLLAAFLANAANKFFVPDLEYEAANSFYAKIFEFHGEAPDQYRILPLLGIKVIEGFLPFNLAVMAFNFLTAFLCFELLFVMLRKASIQSRLTFNLILAGVYIYLQYTGWRPDTMGLLLVGILAILPGFSLPPGPLKQLLTLLGITALAFCRSDIAVVYGVFLAIYQSGPISVRLLFPVIPVVVQLALQFVIFKNAEYYTKPMMLWDNLGMKYLVRNPATWLIPVVILIYFRPITKFIQRSWNSFRFLYLLLAGYVILVLFVGRINEYRLYLPFVPLFIWAWDRTAANYGKKTRRF